MGLLSAVSPEKLARFSGRHPWLIVGLWAVVLVTAGILSATLLSGVLTANQDFTNNPESKRANQVLEDKVRGPMRSQEFVLVRSDSLTVDDPAFKDAVTKLQGDLSALGPGIVESVVSYAQAPEGLVSSDRHTTMIPLTMAGSMDEAADNIEQVHNVVHNANGRDGLQVLITGNSSVGLDFREVSEKDLQKAEFLGIPIALVILVLVFGAIAAAAVPLVLALLCIAVAVGASAVVGQLFDLSFFVTNMITMMGLAVGIDYSLFIVSRYREERRHGREKQEAIRIAGATASRAVLFSGMTVVLALCGMLLVPTTIFRSLAVGAILVVVASVVASLTLLPAALGILGDKVNALRIPFVQTAQGKYDEQRPGGFWDRVAKGVMRYPVLSLVAAVGLLLAAAVPYFDYHAGFSGAGTLPNSFESKQGFLLMEREFSAGAASPAEVVIDGQVSSDQVQSGIQRLQARLAGDPAFGASRFVPGPAGDAGVLSVSMKDEATTPQAVDAIRRLRSDYVPQAFSGVPATVLVTGATAQNVDFFDLTDTYTPIVFAFVLGLSFILLMLVFRSIVVPVKAIIMNLLSVGAAYGLLVLVFEKGFLADLFGFQQVPVIEAWLPLFLFSILFGLSMDYHVFLLSRIRERYDQTKDNTEAVAYGLRATGRLITGAAVIMVAVFAGFATGDLVMFQQMGFGLGAAVLIDATLVRSVLVPASMKLLGNVNWYFPKALRFLPDLRVDEERVRPARGPAPQPRLSPDTNR